MALVWHVAPCLIVLVHSEQKAVKGFSPNCLMKFSPMTATIGNAREALDANLQLQQSYPCAIIAINILFVGFWLLPMTAPVVTAPWTTQRAVAALLIGMLRKDVAGNAGPSPDDGSVLGFVLAMFSPHCHLQCPLERLVH